MGSRIAFFLLFPLFIYSQKPKLVIPKGHTGGITSVSFSPDGKYILSGSRDFTAKLWNRSAHEIVNYKLNKEVQAVAFSPDGKQVITGSNDGKVTLWNLEGEFIRTFEEHKDWITSVAFSFDGKYILSGSRDNTAILRKVEGNFVQKFSHSGPVNSVAFSKDNSHIITGGSDKRAIIWKASGAKGPVLALQNGEINSVCFSDDGKYIVTVGSDFQASLWNMAGTKLHQIRHFEKVMSCDISSDNQTIASGSFDGVVKIWNTQGKVMVSFKAHEYGITSVVFSPDGKSIVTASEDDTMYEWNLKGNAIQKYLRKAASLTAISSSKNGNTILTTCADHSVKIWDVFNNNFLGLKSDPEKISVAVISPDGKFILTGGNDKIARLKYLSGKDSVLYKLDDHITSVAFSTDGTKVLTGCHTGSTKVWELGGKEITKLLQKERITSVAFSPDGSSVATGSFEGIVKHFDLSGKVITTIRVSTYINAICFTANGKNIITGNSNGLIQLWDAKTGEPIQTLGKPGEEILSVSVAPNGKYIASGSYDGYLTIWDLEMETKKLIQAHSNKVTAVHFSSLENILLSGSADGTLKVWNYTEGKEIVQLIALNSSEWAVANSEGLFDASPGAMEIMNYIVGLEVIELDQLKVRYYEPGLLSAKLGITKTELRDVSSFTSVSLFPEITASISSNQLTVDLKERGGGLGFLSLFINNKEVKVDSNKAKKLRIIFNLNEYSKYFDSDTIHISLQVSNNDGWLKSQPYSIQYILSDGSKGGNESGNQTETVIFKGEPTLYAIIVGTSQYSGDKLDLRFPDLDAAAMEKAIKAVAKPLFKEKVFVRLLSTSEKSPENISSKKNIENAFKELIAKAQPKDILVVYFSGHGLTYGEAEKSQFYYLTKDIATEDLKDAQVRDNYTISSSDLSGWLTAIHAKKQVLIFDACHSGKILENIGGSEARELNPSQIRAFDRMKDRTGTFILAGSAADRVSFEASIYGQGLLTYSILEAMSGLALGPGNSVDVSILFNHALERVPVLAKNINKIQKPIISFPKSGGSFDIGIKDQTVNIPLPKTKPVFIRNTLRHKIKFGDPLRLTKALEEYLLSNTAQGADADVVYVDVENYPDGFSIEGFYEDSNGKEVKLVGKLFKGGNPIGDYEVKGDASDKQLFAENIFEKIRPLIDANK